MSDPGVEASRSQDRDRSVLVRPACLRVVTTLVVSQGGQAGRRGAQQSLGGQPDPYSPDGHTNQETDNAAQMRPQTQDRSRPKGGADHAGHRAT